MIKSLTVIIPVYNSFQVALDCLKSVLANTPKNVAILVIDDASPEGDFASFVPQEICSDRRLKILKNASNLGFVGSCNRGMLIESNGDVVLLNSDTLVTPKWIEKLRKAAYSRPNIGTVTPLTNNGTIASVPRFLENNELPPGFSLERFASEIASCSGTEYVSVPTCVGFCTYITRAMLDAVGVFDPAFDKGYGEENDLSQRGAAAGFDNIIDDATFIFHRGNMSFREARESLSERNAAILSSRYPRYNQQVAQFCGANPLSRVHDRVWNFLQQAFIERRARVVLHILHNGPSVARNHALGGTELHVKGIIERESSSAHFSLVRSRGHLYLTAHLDSGDRVLVLSDEFKLSDLISPKFFSVVHLHHSLGFDSQSLFSALREHGNYVVSVHDYHLICNRFFLRTAQGEVCDGFKCNGTCGEVDGSNVQRRELARELFEGAGRIFVFSRSSKDIITRLGVPEQSMQLVQHGISKANGVLAPVPTKPSKAEPIKLVTVGTIVAHKGSELIKRLAGELNEVGGIPIEWHFIGRMEEHADGIISHGEYTAERLGSMLAGIAPHAAILLPHCQETYSLTLDELISRGVAVITGPFGALPERVLEWGVGYVCDYSVDGVKAVLQSMVSEWDKHLEIVSKTKIAPIRSAQAEVDHFGAQYKELGSSRPVRASALLEWLQPDLIRSKRTAKDAIKLFGKSAIIRAVKFVQHYETV